MPSLSFLFACNLVSACAGVPALVLEAVGR